MANICLGALLALAALGGAALVWIWRRWATIAERVTDVPVKVRTVVVKALAASVAAGGAYAAADKADWWCPVVAGLVCVAIWEVVEKLVDGRVKAADKATKTDVAAITTVCEEQAELLDLFRSAVEDRCRRLADAASDRSENPTIPTLRDALAPKSHLKNLLRDLLDLFAFRAEGGPVIAPNFRVGLYVARGGSLVPVVAEDRNNPAYDVFTSHREHAASFRLDATDRVSHAVRCALRRETVIVEDCEKAAADGRFYFFGAGQSGYLRSMVAYFVGEVIDANGNPTLAVLVADSNLAGVFREDQKDSLEFTLREFAARVRIEMVLLSLLSKKGGSDGNR